MQQAHVLNATHNSTRFTLRQKQSNAGSQDGWYNPLWHTYCH